MPHKVKRFSTKQRIFETEDGQHVMPVNSVFRYHKTPKGTYAEGELVGMFRKELLKTLKGQTIEYIVKKSDINLLILYSMI